jgi:hypothetical protein
VSFADHLKQTLTYWPPGSMDQYGKMTYGSPVQKACRWEEISLTFQDKRGEERQSKTRVFLADDVDVDGYVKLGTSAETDPTSVDGAFEIQQKSRVPDLRSVTQITTLVL